MATAADSTSLNDCLLQEGAVTPAQLEAAREQQRSSGYSLCRVLVDMDLLDEDEKIELLQKRFGFDLVSLRKMKVDPTLMRRLPFHFAVKHRVVPIGEMDDRTLILAMEDPTDQMLLGLLQEKLGVAIKPFLARRAEIDRKLRQVEKEVAPGDDTTASESEVYDEPRAPWQQRVINALTTLVIFAPLFVFFLAFWFDMFNFGHRVRAWIAGGKVSQADLIIYLTLGWALWALLIFEVSGLIFSRPKKEDD